MIFSKGFQNGIVLEDAALYKSAADALKRIDPKAATDAGIR
jgi:hypothetical protein